MERAAFMFVTRHTAAARLVDAQPDELKLRLHADCERNGVGVRDMRTAVLTSARSVGNGA
jgi:hypothetical protein